MGSRENVKTAKDKEPKTPPPPAVTATATTQEQNPTTGVATDWTGFQAYSPMPPHGFMQSSPQPPHYMWGMQHIMPPYGTPPQPYVAMYPPGSMYAHPSMPPGSYPYNPYAMASPTGAAEASGNTPSGMEMDGKSSEGKEKLPIKRSKGSLGALNIIAGKSNDLGKHTGVSANGADSKSAESGSENSSEGSDGNSQNDSDTKSGGRQESVEAEATQNGRSLYVSQNGGPGTMVNHSIPTMQMSPSGAPGGVPGPATNLNIGMDYWSTQNASAVPGMHGKVPAAPVAGALVTAGSRDTIQSQLWLKDERELKRQRRKQSNRESARRSRLRKQAECDELAQRAEVLKEENAGLRSEVNRIRSEYEQLAAENASLKERLGETPNREDSTSIRSDEQFQNGVQ